MLTIRVVALMAADYTMRVPLPPIPGSKYCAAKYCSKYIYIYIYIYIRCKLFQIQDLPDQDVPFSIIVTV